MITEPLLREKWMRFTSGCSRMGSYWFDILTIFRYSSNVHGRFSLTSACSYSCRPHECVTPVITTPVLLIFLSASDNAGNMDVLAPSLPRTVNMRNLSNRSGFPLFQCGNSDTAYLWIYPVFSYGHWQATLVLGSAVFIPFWGELLSAGRGIDRGVTAVIIEATTQVLLFLLDIKRKCQSWIKWFSWHN